MISYTFFKINDYKLNKSRNKMKNVDRYTRALKRGFAIFCPHCNEANIVFKFNWKELKCHGCGVWVPKKLYLIDETIAENASIIKNWILKYSRFPVNRRLIMADQLHTLYKITSDYQVVALCEQFRRKNKVPKKPRTISEQHNVNVEYRLYLKMAKFLDLKFKFEFDQYERKMKLWKIYGIANSR